MSVDFELVVAMDQDRGIGLKGTLPWHFPADLKHFKEVTTHATSAQNKNVVVMGRKTWDSLPDKFKPLPNRINVVLTRNKNLQLPANVYKIASLNELDKILKKTTPKRIFIIGGAQVFEEALKNPRTKRIHLTEVRSSFKADTFFPSLGPEWQVLKEKGPVSDQGHFLCFREYAR